jgi:hypothetical protein
MAEEFMTSKLILSITVLTAVTASITGCGRHCYPTELQLAAEMEKKNCQDLGWTYWASEKKNLRAIVCTSNEGDMYHQFEATDKGLCEVKYLRETY